MKLNTLAAAVLVAGFASSQAMAASTDVALHGMVKSGTNWVMNDGFRKGSHGGLGINETGHFYALGNEAVSKLAISPVATWTADDGVYARAELNFQHENYDGDNWDANSHAGGGYVKGMLFIGGFEFNPSTEFWAGKTKDIDAFFTSNYDTGYMEDNGVGGGFQNMDLGFAKLDMNIMTFDNSNGPARGWDQAYLNKTGGSAANGYSVWLKNIGSIGLDVNFRYVTASPNRHETLDDGTQVYKQAKNGYTASVIYNTPGFLWGLDGWSKIIAQYGKGAGSNSKLSTAYYGGLTQDSEMFRFAIDGGINFTKDFQMLAFAFYEHNHGYFSNGESGFWSRNDRYPTVDGLYNRDRDFFTFMIAPVYQFTSHFSLHTQLAYEHANYSGKGWSDVKKGNHDFFKVTVAPTISLGQGFWGAPQIMAFVTYGTWDKSSALSGLVAGGENYTASTSWNSNVSDVENANPNTSAWLFGVQGEAYF